MTDASVSKPITECPAPTDASAIDRPTYPWPMIAIFIGERITRIQEFPLEKPKGGPLRDRL
jgi:hypothetical protein